MVNAMPILDSHDSDLPLDIRARRIMYKTQIQDHKILSDFGITVKPVLGNTYDSYVIVHDMTIRMNADALAGFVNHVYWTNYDMETSNTNVGYRC